MKKCNCRFCTYQYPLYKKLKPNLNKETIELIEDIWMEANQNSEELGVLQAKLAGYWSGYEKYEDRLKLITKIGIYEME